MVLGGVDEPRRGASPLLAIFEAGALGVRHVPPLAESGVVVPRENGVDGRVVVPRQPLHREEIGAREANALDELGLMDVGGAR